MHSGVDSRDDSMMEDSGVDSDVDDGLGFENVDFSKGFQWLQGSLRARVEP